MLSFRCVFAELYDVLVGEVGRAQGQAGDGPGHLRKDVQDEFTRPPQPRRRFRRKLVS